MISISRCRSAKCAGRIAKPDSTPRRNDTTGSATAIVQPTHRHSSGSAAARNSAAQMPRLIGAIDTMARDDVPSVERRNEMLCTTPVSRYAAANSQRSSPNASGTAMAMTRKPAIAASIGSRVDVVVGPTLFASQANPSYIHQTTHSTASACR